MNEEQLSALALAYPNEGVLRLIEAYRVMVRELEQAPTQEQMRSLVSQLKEVRGENSRLREQLRSSKG